MNFNAIPPLAVEAHNARRARLTRFHDASQTLKIAFADASKQTFYEWVAQQDAIRDAKAAEIQDAFDREPWNIMARIKTLAGMIAVREKIHVFRILSVRRNVPLARARQEIAWTLKRDFPAASLPKIALIMGRACGLPDGFHHTTILHGVRRHQARLDAATGGDT